MKKNRIIFTTVFLFIVIFSYFINTNYRYYQIIIELSEFIFWISFSVFILSVISLHIKDSAYFSWRKFTTYFLFFSVLAILVTPTSTHGMDFFPIIKETVTIALTVLYIATSLVLIIYKSFKSN